MKLDRGGRVQNSYLHKQMSLTHKVSKVIGELGHIPARNDVLSTGSEAEVTRSPTVGTEVYTGHTSSWSTKWVKR